jgi:hypothetical protein
MGVTFTTGTDLTDDIHSQFRGLRAGGLLSLCRREARNEVAARDCTLDSSALRKEGAVGGNIFIVKTRLKHVLGVRS